MCFVFSRVCFILGATSVYVFFLFFGGLCSLLITGLLGLLVWIILFVHTLWTQCWPESRPSALCGLTWFGLRAVRTARVGTRAWLSFLCSFVLVCFGLLVSFCALFPFTAAKASPSLPSRTTPWHNYSVTCNLSPARRNIAWKSHKFCANYGWKLQI